MSATQTVKQYGETAAKLYKTQLLATVGAGDLAVERATTAVSRARTAAQQFATSVRHESVRSTVISLVDTARTQATSTVESLAERGEGVVDELRSQPGFRRIVRRAESAVDAVEDKLEDVIEDTAQAVTEASNEVTSVAQKTAAKAAQVADKAEKKVDEAAKSTKETVESAAQ
jgi:heparin binding hemagglutinin HbhA